uniref:EF-hand domain-containing protein n=1 Tax=Oryza rufipogon TaxID=4529 RepID=A0A0E0P301_ORYRU
MSQFVATIEYCSLAVSVSSLLIRFVLHQLVRDAIVLVMSRAGASSLSCALLGLLAHDDTALFAADDRRCAAVVEPPPPLRRECELCARRGGAGLSRRDVAAVVASLGMVAAGEDDDDDDGDDDEACRACEAVAAVEEMTEGKVAGDSELREAFYVFDRDEDGYVSAAELWNVLRRLGMEEGARYGDCVRMIAAYDGDGDGRISFQEFRAMMENTNYTLQRRHSQRTRTHPYEHTHANSTPTSIFEDWPANSGEIDEQLVMASIDRGLVVSVSSLLIVCRGVRAVSRALVRLALLLLVRVVDEDDDFRYCAAAAAGDDAVVQPPRPRCCERCAAAPWLSRHDVAAVVESLGLVAAAAADEDDEACGACEAVAAVEELAESKVAGEGELRGAFRVFDRDGDGYVSAAELRSVLRRLGMEEGARHGDCVRMIAAHDGDGDGRISFQEGGEDDDDAAAARLSRHDVAVVVASLGLVGAADEDDEACGTCEAVAVVEELAESKVAGEGELREAFRVFDRDGDGYVSAAELRRVLRRLGMEEGARHGDCVRMITAHDGDGDGRISFQEFTLTRDRFLQRQEQCTVPCLSARGDAGELASRCLDWETRMQDAEVESLRNLDISLAYLEEFGTIDA